MTREEAILELQNCKGLIQQDGQDYLDERDIPLLNTAIDALKALPSAEAEPTVIRSRTLMPTKDFKEWAKRIREVNSNAVVIPCDAEVVSADVEEMVLHKILEKGMIELPQEYVSVVRCKDCRWYDNYCDVCHNPRYGDGHANYQPPYVDEDYFCKDGKGGDVE